MTNTYDEQDRDELLSKTICTKCIHNMVKQISPLDPESFGLDEETIESLIDEDGDVILEQHTCLMSHEDMDYLVLECSHFTDKDKGSLFKTDLFK